MGLLGGIMKSVVNPMSLAQIAMGPAGWASLAFKMMGSAIAQQAIQQIGQKLGLPQSVINTAQDAFTAASGFQGGPSTVKEAASTLAELGGLSTTQAAQLERSGDNTLRNFVKNALEGKYNGDETSSASNGGKGESFLVAFAKAMGKSMDTKMNKMMDISKKIDQETKKANDSDGKKQAVTGEMSAELQALGQEVSMLSQAISNSLKSMGEAGSTLARKN